MQQHWFRMAKTAGSEFRQNRHNGRLKRPARHLNPAVGVDVDIDFAANSKLRKIDSGFDGEQTARQDAAGFVSFQIINVRAIAVGFLSHIVARAVAEVGTISGRFDDASDGIIHFPALKQPPVSERSFDAFDAGIASRSRRNPTASCRGPDGGGLRDDSPRMVGQSAGTLA